MLTYQATDGYWQQFYALPPEQKQSVREKWKIFKLDPFDPRLGTHKIHRLSSIWGQTVYSVSVEGNLRVIFLIVGNEVRTVGVGTHDLYK
jgi:hypothetical protein